MMMVHIHLPERGMQPSVCSFQTSLGPEIHAAPAAVRAAAPVAVGMV
jgi:hypothetical protein